MLEKIGFERLVNETVTVERASIVMTTYQFILAIVRGLYVGFAREDRKNWAAFLHELLYKAASRLIIRHYVNFAGSDRCYFRSWLRGTVRRKRDSCSKRCSKAISGWYSLTPVITNWNDTGYAAGR